MEVITDTQKIKTGFFRETTVFQEALRGMLLANQTVSDFHNEFRFSLVSVEMVTRTEVPILVP
jgi:hypothetical protein